VAILTEPLARVGAIVEGAYPSTPVSGRSVPEGRHRSTRLHGDLRDPQFPGAHFNRGYDLAVVSSGNVPGDPPNRNAGSKRRRVVVEVAIGYLIARDAPRAAGAGSTLYDATMTAHSDHEQIAEALGWSAFWGGTSPAIVGAVPDGDVQTVVVVPQARIVVAARWALTLSYPPGTVWT
jgi:hypothetical protein